MAAVKANKSQYSVMLCVLPFSHFPAGAPPFGRGAMPPDPAKAGHQRIKKPSAQMRFTF
jgi:hypothetical protein